MHVKIVPKRQNYFDGENLSYDLKDEDVEWLESNRKSYDKYPYTLKQLLR